MHEYVGKRLARAARPEMAVITAAIRHDEIAAAETGTRPAIMYPEVMAIKSTRPSGRAALKEMKKEIVFLVWPYSKLLNCLRGE